MMKRFFNYLKKIDSDTYYKLLAFYSYCKKFKRIPNVFKPKRFTEKVLMARIRYNKSDTFLTETADKYEVRQYVADKIGEEWLSDVYQVVNRAEDLDFDSISYPSVLKSTHGTAQIKVLESRDSFDEEETIRECSEWLEKEFPLWYSKIQPRLIVEEFLSVDKGLEASGVGNVPPDYKFFVFSGRVEFIVVDLDRFTGHKRSLFSRDWEYLDEKYEFPKGGDLPKPINLDKMVEAAEVLSDDRKFVRIDFYDLGERTVFGEVTHSPNASIVQFSDAFDYRAGVLWK